MAKSEPKKALTHGRRPGICLLVYFGVSLQASCVTNETYFANRTTTIRSHSEVHKGPPIDGRSCLLGYVAAAESTEPIARAAVWLEQENKTGNISAILTDEQGFFFIDNLPSGLYRLDVFQRARRHTQKHVRIEATSITLTTVHLAPQ